MKITFVGTGDAFGSGGRFHTCFNLETGGQRILVDCGASTLVAMNSMGMERRGIDAIVLSHLHGDHIGGLPFLLLECQFVTGRKEPLIIVGPPGTRQRVHELTEAMFPGAVASCSGFLVDFVELEPGSRTEVLGIGVESFLVIHPSGAPATGLRISHGGKVFAYSGDTCWTDTLVDIARNADLFVCECFGKDSETPYHLNYRTLLEKRPLFTARRIMLTHMSPEMLAALDEVEFETAEDGLVVQL
jgi:ribonuclease BN (tRNA processing enzyme)